MQEYKRQIAYLYAYERGEQLRSTGFVKAEERGGHCRLALHLRGYCHSGEAAGKCLYLFLSSGQNHRNLSWSTEESRTVHWNGRENWMRKIFWERESDLQTLTESGSSVLVEETMWRKGALPVDTKRFVLYPEGAPVASAVHGLAV